MPTVAVIVGSLSAASINRHYARALAKLGAPLLEFDFIDLSALPHYNNDLLANPPQAVLVHGWIPRCMELDRRGRMP